ncbi:MAG: helix-turn-helix domain-containing protein [Parasphingopyxis sp.]|nr:helix-turn-helix domain-containing protein [Sphingomonadales bacterium]
MADLRFEKSRYRSNTDRKRAGQAPLNKGEVAGRIAARAAELKLKQSDIAARLGIPKTTMSRIWKGENLPDSAILFPLSDLLGRSPRWLLYGGEEFSPELPNEEWLSLPVYNFARISRDGKGEPSGEMPLRRDWLERKLSNAGNLWLTEMPNDLLDDVAGEGETIICSDVATDASELADGRVYVLLLDGQPVIRRVSFEPDSILLSTSSTRLPPIRMPRANNGGSIHPVARVRGALLLIPL